MMIDDCKCGGIGCVHCDPKICSGCGLPFYIGELLSSSEDIVKYCKCPLQYTVVVADKNDPINPSHYHGGRKYEPIDVIEDWGLDFCLSNVIKYISRAGRKDPYKIIEDLTKAEWYLKRRIQFLEKEKEGKYFTMKYRVVETDDPWKLSSNVEDLLGRGWECQGGVSIAMVKTEFSKKNKYVQAMIKKEGK